ncbi:MAG: tetratricopeptide repeat protein [Lacibacter sp.]
MRAAIIIILYLVLVTGRAGAQGNPPADLLVQAQQYRAAGNCNKAIPLLEASLQQNPDFTPALLLLAQCYNAQQQYQKTLERLQPYHTVLQVDMALLLERAKAFAALGNVPDAQYDLERLLELQPAHAPALTLRADLLRQQLQNSAEALDWYKKAIAAAPDNGYNYAWAGWCCNDLGRFAEAVPFLEQALQKAPALKAFVLAEWGFALYGQNNYAAAKEHLQRALAADAQHAAAYYYLGLCHVREQNKQAAVKQYNQLVLLKSPYAAPLLQQIRALQQP